MVAFEDVTEGAGCGANLVVSGDFGDHIERIGGLVSCENFGADGGLFVHGGRAAQDDLKDARVKPVADKQVSVVGGNFGVSDDHTDFAVAFEAVFRPVDGADKDFFAIHDHALGMDLCDASGGQVE